MQTLEFSKLLNSLTKLTHSQCKKVVASLEADNKAHLLQQLIEKKSQNRSQCPHCGSNQIIRFGKSDGLQRYRCKSCLHRFNALTGTPLAHLRYKERWFNYASEIILGHSIKKSAANCSIHETTSFRWRHRFLNLPASMQSSELSGIAEADETYFLKSLKGQNNIPRKPRKRGGKAQKRGLSKELDCVLVARDRSGHTLAKLMEQFNADALNKVLKPLLVNDTLLCTDGFRVYQSFTNKAHIPHQPLVASLGIRVIDKVFHIQNVNAFDSRLKAWMKKFNGVATRYLPNYLGWFRIIDGLKKQINPENIVLSAIGSDYHQLTPI